MLFSTPMTPSLDQRLAGPVGRLERVLVAAVGFAALMAVYIGVGLYASARPEAQRTLATPLDGLVPLLPWTAMVYGLLYAQVFVPLALLVDRRVLLRGGVAYVTLVLLGLPFWVFWPVVVPREPVPVEDLFTWSLALIRFLDPPTNCFPSMHVAEASLAALLVRRLDRRLGHAMLGLAVAIWLSTLTLRQHWVLDGVAGFALALAADHLLFGRSPLPPEAWVSAGRRRALWALVVYAGFVVAFAAPWFLQWQPVMAQVLGG